MKKLSDYKGEEAIELWADLLEPIAELISSKEIADTIKSGASKITIAKTILKNNPDKAVSILERIDDTPVDGMNVIVRLIELLAEMGSNDTVKSFFGYAGQDKKE